MSTQSFVRQEATTVGDNALGIDPKVAEQSIDALNTDLAAASMVYHQLQKHHWTVEGAEAGQLHDWFGDAAAEMEDTVDAIGERVVALGGVPISDPAAIAAHAPVEFEGADVFDARTTLNNDRAQYTELITLAREHVALVESLEDFGSGELLRGHLEDLEGRADDLKSYLANDTLVHEHALRRE